MTIEDVDKEILNFISNNKSYFVEWNPNNIKSVLFNIPHKGIHTAVTSIGNSTAIQEMFKRIHDQFTVLFKKKSFFKWYTGEGMDEMEFTEAESKLIDLITEYKSYQGTSDDDEEGEEVEEG